MLNGKNNSMILWHEGHYQIVLFVWLTNIYVPCKCSQNNINWGIDVL